MITQGVGYTFQNSPGGLSLVIDPPTPLKRDGAFYVYEDTTADGVAVIRINAGTFNNTFPTVNGVQAGLPTAYLARPSATSIVVLTAPASQTSNAPFPSDTPTITMVSGTNVPAATATTAKVAIAKIVATPVEGSAVPVLEITQLISGSIWGERYSCGSQLDYWFSQI